MSTVPRKKKIDDGAGAWGIVHSVERGGAKPTGTESRPVGDARRPTTVELVVQHSQKELNLSLCGDQRGNLLTHWSLEDVIETVTRGIDAVRNIFMCGTCDGVTPCYEIGKLCTEDGKLRGDCPRCGGRSDFFVKQRSPEVRDAGWLLKADSREEHNAATLTTPNGLAIRISSYPDGRIRLRMKEAAPMVIKECYLTGKKDVIVTLAREERAE